MKEVHSWHRMLQPQGHHQPEDHWKRSCEVIGYYCPHQNSIFLLLECLKFRDHKVHATERPHVVLVSDDSVETNEVEQDEALAEEQ